MQHISVVISTYAEERLPLVMDCIDSLRKQTLTPFEIILVIEPIRSLIEFYRSRMPSDVRVLAGEGYGLSNARNAGAKRAKGEIIAFIDDDATADKRWLQEMVRNYEDPNVVGVGGYAEPAWDSGSRPSWFPEDLDWIIGCSYKGLPEQKACVRNPIGCNMSFRRDAFCTVGYFGTNIGRVTNRPLAGEEAEFSLRALSGILASKIIFCPEALVYHKVPEHRARLSYVLKRSFYEGISKAIIMNTNSSTTEVLSTEGNYLSYLLLKSIPSRLKRFPSKRNFAQIATILLSVGSVLLGYVWGRVARIS